MYYLKVIESTLANGFRSGNIATVTVLVNLFVSLLFGMYIYFIYRFNCQGGFYDSGFNKTLAILPTITAGIMLAMQSNVLVSLGMVGALSIVRFRNAVKNPIDLTYLFWSISMGIAIGISLFKVAALLSVCVTVLIFGIDLIPAMRAPYIFAVTGDKTLEETVLAEHVKKYCAAVRVRSRNVCAESTEWILELKTKKPAQLIEDISSMSGIASANLLSHDGDVRF